jgi:OOP family OmpA-OmpF porin
MSSKSKVVFSLLCIVLLVTSIAFAQDKDIEGSKDHPLISRFPGSIIILYDVKKFDEYILPLGKLDEERKLSKSQRLEGKITRIQYKAPENLSTLEIYRNYELALKKAGFEILFAGTERELEWRWTYQLYEDINPLMGDYYGIESEEDFRYLSAKLSRPEGDVYVSLCVSLAHGLLAIQLDVIEVKPMEIGLVTVNADALAKDIARTGHVAVYGIYFDTDKAEVKPESEPIFQEIAKLLQQNPKLKLYVVGHTDNVGSLTYNMKLSQARADAVVTKLISKYNVNAKRLEAHGVGFLAPVASNKNEEGRAKNRRVELVEQ